MSEETPTDPSGAPPHLSYPRSWTYTLIVEREEVVRRAVERVLGSSEHTLSFSNASRGGRYRSYQLELVVESQEQRDRLFRELRRHPGVRYIL